MAQSYALITGATSGMGYEFARQLASAHHNIVVVSNQRERNIEVANELTERYGIETLPLYADLTDSGSAEQIYDCCRSHNIEVDILISNAGMLHFAYLNATSCDDIERFVTLHCTVPMKLCRLFAADMVARRRGYIVIMSSMTAWIPYPTMSLYGSTKACLKSFAQSLWYECHQAGVGVTCVFPGAVDTPLYDLSPKRRKVLHRFGLMMRAETVVRRTLRRVFRKRRIYIPGWFTKVAVFFCKIMPAHALLPIMQIPAIRRILDSKQQQQA
ncbi:MAG: SDR family NAD(P)-dependent oxidoreductase [Alistipes sp.]|nr:SDR family NAD(P)-dependent oxidoreductase [Alistipes sp.]